MLLLSRYYTFALFNVIYNWKSKILLLILHWHQSIVKFWLYHISKSEFCTWQNVLLFHVWVFPTLVAVHNCILEGIPLRSLIYYPHFMTALMLKIVVCPPWILCHQLRKTEPMPDVIRSQRVCLITIGQCFKSKICSHMYHVITQ